MNDTREPVKKTAEQSGRFAVNRWTLFADRAMNRFIQFGGVTVIAAVFGILIFIAAQAWPLFRGARVGADVPVPLKTTPASIVGVDESERVYFSCDPEGALVFYNDTGAEISRWNPNLPAGVQVTARVLGAQRKTLAYGLSDGRVATVSLNFTTTHQAGGRSTVAAAPVMDEPLTAGLPGVPVARVHFAEGAEGKIFAVEQRQGDRTVLHAVRAVEKRTLMGTVRAEVGSPVRLDERMAEPVAQVAVAAAGRVAVADTAGAIYFFRGDEEGFVPGQEPFRPFAGSTTPAVAAMDFVFGDVSLILVGQDGANVIWSLTPVKQENGLIGRRWQLTKTFPDIAGGQVRIAPSSGNKAFLLVSDREASLRYATTESVRWTAPVSFPPAAAFLGIHYHSINFLDAAGTLHRYALKDPHPEAGWKAFFGKIWYEGASRPEWTWQSSSANDDFEAKLSLMPLIFGTLKGTVYALIFALPVSLLAAIYMAQFMRPEHKRFIKPAMEIMASLPSVVLGFIAALWLAPKVETQVPSLLLAVLALPVSALLFGLIWSRLPKAWRRWVPSGWEFVALVPVVMLACVGAWQMGPWLESWLFVWQDPATGVAVADFRLWWTQLSGAGFEQRNCLVVGFIMGFAVIPVVFTIAEDALSNVPRSLVSASLALGASRWQTAWRVVVPTASPGIFSGVMIGFGRAIGETMIVVMATGNTAVMDWNIFNGMRTLSANIAVELPEAAVGSTHFRALFLGACCLFLLTFVLNTIAELLRQNLREKYKVV